MEVVTVPAGVVGGQQLMLQMPSGSTRQVVVPAGLKAGDKFRVAAPGSGPPVPMGKPVPPMGEPVPQPPVVGRPPVDPEVARLQAELELLRERNRHAEEEAARARAADNARIQAMEDQRRREQAEVKAQRLNGVWRYVRSKGTYTGTVHWGTQVKFAGMHGWYNGPKGHLCGPEPPNYHLISNNVQDIRGREHWPNCGYDSELQGCIQGDGLLRLTTDGSSTAWFKRDDRPYRPES